MQMHTTVSVYDNFILLLHFMNVWLFSLAFCDCPIVCAHLAFTHYAQSAERNELDECNAFICFSFFQPFYTLIIDQKNIH